MNASSICSPRFDLGAEVRVAAHQAILIFTSSVRRMHAARDK